MTTRTVLSGTVFCIALLVVGCAPPSGSTDPSPSDAPGPKSAPAETQAAAPAPVPESPMTAQAPVPEAQAVAPAPPKTPVTSSTEPPARSVTPVEPAPASASPAAPRPVAQERPTPAAGADIVDPGGAIAVAEIRPGLKRIGSNACGDCHEVQFTSWSEGPHATRTPPLDCESCHGPGSEYKRISVMQDAEKSRAAGLVIPDRAFCLQCHKTGLNDDLMMRVHAHGE